MTPKRQPTPVAMLNVAGLVVAAAGIMLQYVSGAVVQIVGLVIALPAGIVAVKLGSRRAGVAARPLGAQ